MHVFIYELFGIRTDSFSTLNLYLFYSPVLCRIFDSVKIFYNLANTQTWKEVADKLCYKKYKLYFIQSGEKMKHLPDKVASYEHTQLRDEKWKR